MRCDEVTIKEPCFATFACLCDNGYFSISSEMPDIPEDYEGLNQEIVEEIEEEQKKELDSEEVTTTVLGLELWQLTVFVVGGILFIGFLTWGICKWRAHCKNKKSSITPSKGGEKGDSVEMGKRSARKGKLAERRISIGDDMRKSINQHIENDDTKQLNDDEKGGSIDQT